MCILLAACGTAPDPSPDAGAADDAPTAAPTSSGEEPAVSDPQPTPSPTRTLEPPVPETVPAPAVPPGYELVAGETGVAAKRAAVDLVEALTTYGPDDRPADVVARATDDPDLAAHLLEAAGPLSVPDSWSRGSVVYPQLGGLEVDAAAVITVVRQELTDAAGTVTVVTRVLDVRVDRGPGGVWRVTELASAGGEPVPRPDYLSAAAAAVLDDGRIELPDTTRWDVHRGAIDDQLLELMSRMADVTAYGVVVLETGHSREVFGTDRTSRHAEGRAVDLYRVGDRLVIEDRAEGSATHQLVRWLHDQPELSEVGSPWALDGYGGRSFSDELHQDHVHVGVLRPGEARRSAPPR